MAFTSCHVIGFVPEALNGRQVMETPYYHQREGITAFPLRDYQYFIDN